MPLSTPTSKYGIRITTVDTTNGVIEGTLKTGGTARIPIYNTPPAFRWPQVGEAWMVRQENGTWILDGMWTTTDNPNPGDLVLNSGSGVVRVEGSADGATDFTFDKNGIPAVIPIYVSQQAIDATGVNTYYKASAGTTTLAGGMVDDVLHNGPKVPIDGWYQVDISMRWDQGATNGFLTLQSEIWTPTRTFGSNANLVWLGGNLGAGQAGTFNMTGLVPLTAGEYLFMYLTGTATTTWRGLTSWNSNYSVSWRSPRT